MFNSTIAIIDDDKDVGASLSWFIESLGYQVNNYNMAEPFLATVEKKQPDCLILDIRMPLMSGFELQETLKNRNLDIPTIFITGHGDIPMAVHAIQQGAMHFLTKPINNQLLLEAVNKAVRKSLRQKQQQLAKKEIENRVKYLTRREYQVMCHMVQGKLTKVIATELNISQSTVELHRSKVMKKMAVASLAELVALTIKYELTSCL